MLWLWTICLAVPYTSSNHVALHVQRAFRLKPADDQTVEFQELGDAALIHTFGMDHTTLRRVAKQFAKLDSDRSGNLDVGELAKLERWVSGSFESSAKKKVGRPCFARPDAAAQEEHAEEEHAQEEHAALCASIDAADQDSDHELNFGEFISWYGKRQKEIYANKKRRKTQKRSSGSVDHE